ncbi:HlyD family secretion protein [Luteimonas deserti]|uniref:HlyD family efflux transporter periplasmic adaptor subunit n=1 Tax=Luteimonas deserti TaxID=2752306 RepID=A0A7Z0QML2_9GAMM|nr:HlyD family efflux transporter periplasmic adaptor subunit [Luteimonas deserti]NYZ61344.1 HlyD family efflux transporter periplasmic adaptor subunit [Luteimonas deserti]
MPALALWIALALSACAEQAPQALGTIEYDRILIPAPASEAITDVDVREGQQVAAGQRLVQLEVARARTRLSAAQARTRQSADALEELRSGPRTEAILLARANVSRARAQAVRARDDYARVRPLGRQQLVADADVARARAEAQAMDAQLEAANAELLLLERGTRNEQLDQGRAALAAAEADAQAQVVSFEELAVSAPRAGRVDSLPYRVGDRPPTGAAVAILLVGDAPHARIYVPATLLPHVRVGTAARVSIEGHDQAFAGTVRMLRSEPSYTPYYALTGADAARLSYLAEVQLDDAAAALPAGLPARVTFGASRP